MLIQDQQPPTRFSRPAIQDQYRPQPLANFVQRSIEAPQENKLDKVDIDEHRELIIYIQSIINDFDDDLSKPQELNKEEAENLYNALISGGYEDLAFKLNTDFENEEKINKTYIRRIMGEIDKGEVFEYPDNIKHVPREVEMKGISYSGESDDDVEDVPVIVPKRAEARTQQQPRIDDNITPTPFQTPKLSQHPPIRPPESFHSPQSEASTEPQQPPRQSARIAVAPKQKITQEFISSFIPSSPVKKAQKLTYSEAQAYARYAAILSINTDKTKEEIMSMPFARLRREAGKYASV
jgi:hypothetical protein